VERENNKSMSPAWRERDYLTRVFQRVDKKRHGRVTGDCDVSMFMRVWGVSATRKKTSFQNDVFEEDDGLEGLEDAEILHDENEAFVARNEDEQTHVASKNTASPSKKTATKVSLVPGTNLSAVPLRRARKPDGRFESVALPPVESESSRGDVGVTPNSVAALFCKYGYDKDGFMPYEVFVNALLSRPPDCWAWRSSWTPRSATSTGTTTGTISRTTARFYTPSAATACSLLPSSTPSSFEEANARPRRS
jgi:hypothetical protein